jgi:peptidoglycan hydrolase FlgJ
MIGRADLNDKLAFDTKSLDSLKQSSKDNSPESVRAAATQFEALFTNMMLKSMRQAGGNESAMDSDQSKMYVSMLDEQFSQTVAKKGLGLADALVRQLSNNQADQVLQGEQSGVSDVSGNVPGVSNQFMARGIDSYLKNQGAEAVAPTKPSTAQRKHVREFEDKLGSHAEKISRETGIPAKFMLGQAALESGWGKREIKAADGSPSHNIFGMKATSAWKGKTVTAVTTEYIDGVAHRKLEKFKAYDSYSDAFKDYAKLLIKNPRYEKVIANATDASSFAMSLQKAGYATDPQYASKLTRIIKQTLSA